MTNTELLTAWQTAKEHLMNQLIKDGMSPLDAKKLVTRTKGKASFIRQVLMTEYQCGRLFNTPETDYNTTREQLYFRLTANLQFARKAYFAHQLKQQTTLF